ncbi:fluoride efflux transporter CrcB [Plantactinospora sp. KLBMP9567]|uniref:fluoride efflux transporter CrcB n=1 Tax=Plantactinospora sp. KLBMP9567 TaxID=3085900 RepID=UPI0029821928|nr:fluoride efflux transporter CrcB [Plantactinospora sp. KLBMP9567]MDW5328545.1 fluoride efflux transporter CrcB [Plantactinospora sp. KLBMP9567]
MDPPRSAEPDEPEEPHQPHEPDEPDEPPALPNRPGWDVFAVVALGGALGAAGRYGLVVLWPHAPTGVPWATLLTNLSGCALIGLLMRLVTTAAPHRLVRPFLGTGILGGFTTFSTYAVETRGLLAAGRPGVAVGYLLGTLAGALVAVRLGMWAADRVRS